MFADRMKDTERSYQLEMEVIRQNAKKSISQLEMQNERLKNSEEQLRYDIRLYKDVSACVCACVCMCVYVCACKQLRNFRYVRSYIILYRFYMHVHTYLHLLHALLFALLY